jgi:putative ABC transport system substrate-binding protein
MRRALMQRRTFASHLGSAIAWPLWARAQRRDVPAIGYLQAVARSTVEKFLAAFRSGLAETGFEEGRNVIIEYRFADGDYARLPALARELVALNVNVIVAGGGPPSALAAKAATAIIPIVFTAIADPRDGGLVASYSRPGGNATGISVLTTELDSKRLELLCDLVPAASTVGVLANPNRPDADRQTRDVARAANALNRRLVVMRAGTEREIEEAFARLRESGAEALVVLADPYFTSRRTQITALAVRHRLPAMYQWRDFAEVGGLMSYGPSLADAYRHAGLYTGRILKGEKPADLPVLQPTKFELVINARTARALGLTITEAMLARADEVIE